MSNKKIIAESNPKGKVVGDKINPWRGECGLYLPDIVGRRGELSDFEKRLYERLVRYAGKNGLCIPAMQTLALDLCKSLIQVKRGIKKLIALGLISRDLRGKRKSNSYNFLWHPWFEVSPAIPVQTEQTDENDTPEVSPVIQLWYHQRAPNSVQELNTRNSSSSSETVPSSSSLDEEEDSSISWLTDPNNRLEAREALKAAAQLSDWNRTWVLPESSIILEMNAAVRFEGIEEFKAYCSDLEHRGQKPKYYQFYIADVKKWPERKADKAHAPKAIGEPLDECAKCGEPQALCACGWTPYGSPSSGFVPKRHGVFSCEDCHDTGLENGRKCSCAKGRALTKCLKCTDQGTVSISPSSFSSLIAWCDCDTAQTKREAEPDYVDKFNLSIQDSNNKMVKNSWVSCACGDTGFRYIPEKNGVIPCECRKADRRAS